MDSRNRFIQPPQRHQKVGVPVMSRGIARAELDRALEAALSRTPVPLVKAPSEGERGVRFRQGCVDFERLQGRVSGFQKGVAGGQGAITPAEERRGGKERRSR